jgi:SAM-dependent methyltransferase
MTSGSSPGAGEGYPERLAGDAPTPQEDAGERAAEERIRDGADAFYWAFEDRMRGSSATIRDRLRVYEPLARDLAAEAMRAGRSSPRWVDLGCGRGEFCELLDAWGWRTEGVDRSPAAIDACSARGIQASLMDVFEFLLSCRAGAFDAVSAIQLIEHVPKERWLELFRGMFEVLMPGGAIVIETINGQNLRALADHFFADLTHTWPGHPQTLRLLAEHAGFVDVEVRFEHPDGYGAAEDVTIVAMKASD